MSGPGTGNKATIAFPVAGLTGCVTMIGGIEFELGDEDVSCLATDAVEEVELHDVAKMSETEVEMLLDDSLAIIFDGATIPAGGGLKLGHKELLTITSPTRDGDATPSPFAAWGGIKKIGLPEYVNGTVRKIKFTIKWLNRDASGTQVKPAYTPAVAS